MDKKIALITGLVKLSDKSRVSEEELRDFRNIFSLFVSEIVSEDEYFDLFDELISENLISKKDGYVYLSREGEALSAAVSVRVLGQTSMESLEKIIADYKKDRKAYLLKVGQNIKSLSERNEGKITEEVLSEVKAMGFIVSVKNKVESLFQSHVKLPSELLRDRDLLLKEINSSVQRLIKKTGLPILYLLKDDGILELNSFVGIHSIRLFSRDFSLLDIGKQSYESFSEIKSAVLSIYIEKAFLKLGYIKTWTGRTFINYNKYNVVKTNVGELRECEAFEIEFLDLPGDKMFVWLQSYTSPTKRLSDFIKENLRDLQIENVLEKLKNLKIRSIPFGSEVKIKRLEEKIDISEGEIPFSNETFEKYWKNRYGIILSEKKQFIVIGEGTDTDYHYPSEMLFIDKNSIAKYYKRQPERKTKAENPFHRANKVQQIFHEFKQNKQLDLDEYLSIKFEEHNPSLKEFQDYGVIEMALRVQQPVLEFNSGVTSLDPSNIFNADYEAKCGFKNLTISHFLVPKNVTEIQIETFLRGLQKTFSISGFGKIYKSPNLKVIRFDENSRDNFESTLRELDKKSTSNQIGILVTPDSSDFYYSGKRLFPSRTGIPLQSVSFSSFIEAQEDKFKGFRILCLKILIKSLKSGEAIWTLSNNAGLLPQKSMYIGIGFSADYREGKISKCATVLHDSKGNKVSWKVFATIQSRTITKQWFDTLLQRVQDFVEKEKPERLVFYRTGILSPVELSAIKLSLEDCSWKKDFDFCFVSVLDAPNNRFYLSNNFKNVPAGYSIILNETECLLSTSNYDSRELRQGTIVPIKLRLEIGKSKIVDILKEYHDLTYLNWSAPYTTAKHPLVITVAERFSELTRENISVENMFYLDL